MQTHGNLNTKSAGGSCSTAMHRLCNPVASQLCNHLVGGTAIRFCRLCYDVV